jgi:hypothetical protein
MRDPELQSFRIVDPDLVTMNAGLNVIFIGVLDFMHYF